MAFVKKPTDMLEVISALKYFKIKKLFIISHKNSRFKNLLAYAKFYLIKKNIKTTYLYYDFVNSTKKKFIEYLEKLEEFKYIALPLNFNRSFYTSVSNLKQKNKVIIAISEGILDGLGKFRFLLAKQKYKSFMAIKMLAYFNYIFNEADYCFFSCYPVESAFAKKTLPVAKNIIIDKQITKLLRKNKVTNLIIQGRGETIKSIKKRYPEIKSYCSTIKWVKKICINDKIYKTRNYVIAEEIINTGLIKTVYSTMSSVIFFAKKKGIKVKLIKNKFNYGLFSKYFCEKKWSEF